MLEVGKQAHKVLSKGQGKGEGKGTYAQYHVINIHGCIFGPFHWHTMLSTAGIFTGQNLTTGKANAWNTHIHYSVFESLWQY